MAIPREYWPKVITLHCWLGTEELVQDWLRINILQYGAKHVKISSFFYHVLLSCNIMSFGQMKFWFEDFYVNFFEDFLECCDFLILVIKLIWWMFIFLI